MVEEQPSNGVGSDDSGGGLLFNRRRFMQATGIVGGTALFGQNGAADIDGVEGDGTAGKHLPADIKMLATGGTIASAQEGQSTGYGLALTGEQILNAVPEIEAYANLTVEQIAQKGSSDLLPSDYANVAKAARKAESDGFDGVIVTHGTDAIEEDAFYNDLVLNLDIPVVFVGAMRPADAVSADGPANLITAIRAASRPELHLEDEPSGVYVTLNEEVHTARDVTKGHSSKLDTFTSLYAGPLGVFTDEFRMFRSPGSYSPDLSDQLETTKKVPIVQTGAGAGAYVIQQAINGAYEVDGIVVEATGRGGSSPPIDEAKEKAVKAGIPVVTSSRTFSGPAPYGTITAGDLPAHKARLLLMLALERTTDMEELHSIFDEANYGRGGLAPSAVSVTEDGGVEVDPAGYIEPSE